MFTVSGMASRIAALGGALLLGACAVPGTSDKLAAEAGGPLCDQINNLLLSGQRNSFGLRFAEAENAFAELQTIYSLNDVGAACPRATSMAFILMNQALAYSSQERFVTADGFAFNACVALFGRGVVLIIAATALATVVLATVVTVLVVAIVALLVVLAVLVALRARLFLASLVVGNHTEIVVGELQVICGLNTVAIMLSVLSKLLIFIQQLRRIAARPAVNPVERVSATLITIAATTAAIISITIQGEFFLIRDLHPKSKNGAWSSDPLPQASPQ